ncbi:MAG: hypothetical protein ACF8NJ_03635, partial [Phycisphaerales bacterium JB038]
MTGYERIARSAGRRMLLNELQQHASRYLLLGLGLSLLLLLADRLLGLGLNPILIGATPAAASVDASRQPGRRGQPPRRQASP